MSIEKIIRELERIKNCCQPGSAWRETVGAAIEKLKVHPEAKPIKTADPVHAAGGCYCRECLRGKKASAEKIACPLSTVYRLPTDFCSDGKSMPIDFDAKDETL